MCKGNRRVSLHASLAWVGVGGVKRVARDMREGSCQRQGFQVESVSASSSSSYIGWRSVVFGGRGCYGVCGSQRGRVGFLFPIVVVWAFRFYARVVIRSAKGRRRSRVCEFSPNVGSRATRGRRRVTRLSQCRMMSRRRGQGGTRCGGCAIRCRVGDSPV